MVIIEKRYWMWVAMMIVVGAAFLAWLNRSAEQGESVSVQQPIVSDGDQHPLPLQRAQTQDEMPPFLEESFLAVSLGALEKNGSNLSLPMRSRHQVRCESREIAHQVRAWGDSSDFETAEPSIFLGHGGVEFFDVELIRTEVPQVDRIQDQGRLIRDGLAEVAGADYSTWVGEIVSNSKS